MVTAEEYALLAKRVYDAPAELRAPVPEGWEVLEEIPDDGWGFSAGVYRRIGTDEIVVSYAGTSGIIDIDWLTNLTTGTGFANEQVTRAMLLFADVQATYGGSDITFTGHSLGGGLASLMSVYFDRLATVFDPAPFAASALSPFTAPILFNVYAAYQFFHGRSVDDAFAQFASSPTLLTESRDENVTAHSILGEALQALRFAALVGEGQDETISVGFTNLGSGQLHSMSLLAAVIASAAFQEALSAVPFAVDVLFDAELYQGNAQKPDFLTYLLRNHVGMGVGSPYPVGNGMLDRLAADLMQLVLPGAANEQSLREGLIALAMGYYYTSDFAGGAATELFGDVAGGIHFDATRIPLDVGPGWTRFLESVRTLTSAEESVRVEQIAVQARDWTIQSFTALTATGGGSSDVMIGGATADTLNGGAGADALIGGGGADTLTGGTSNDVLVGGSEADSLDGGDHDDWLSGGDGDDILIGGTGSDVLRGGNGIDQYRFATGDGADVIEDSDGQGVIQFNGGVLQAGERLSQTKWRSVGGGLILERRAVTTPGGSGFNLFITDEAGTVAITIRNWVDGMFEISLSEDDVPVPDDVANPANQTINVISGDLEPQLNGDDEIIYDQWGNIVPDGPAPDRADEIFDTPGSDLILAGGGNDVVRVMRGGGDVVDGGAGNDHLRVTIDVGTDLLGGDGRDWVQAGGGDDVVEGGTGEDVMHGFVGADQIFGDQAVLLAAAIETGRAADDIAAYGDLIDGGLGDDILVGTATQDLLSGGSGSDLLIGGAGKDFITGDGSYQAFLPNGMAGSWDWSITLTITNNGGTNAYNYTINGGSAFSDGGEGDADIIYAGNGDDDILAGEGADEVYGEDGNDIIFGDEGNDTLIGGAGDDLLDGGDADEDPTGRDFLDGGEGDDRLSGSDGDDVLFGGAGNDDLSGDDGSEFDGSDYLDGEDGNDILRGGGGADVMFGGAGADELFGESSDTPEELQRADFLDGGEGNDTLVGGGGADELHGGEGDDTLAGDAGNTPEAVQGDDFLDGGAGNDTLIGEGGRDRLFGGDGNDSLYGESSATPEAVHDDDFLDGGAGDDTLVGEGGADTLLGGDGNDQLFGESSSTPEGVHGNDMLRGGAGDDVLGGGGGSDTLFGGDGNDQLFGDSSALPEALQGNDLLDGGAGNDQLQGYRGDDLLFGGDGDDVLLGMEDDDSLSGGSGDDILQGGDGDDYLAGGADDDSLSGGQGEDFLTGGDGNDILSGGAGNDALSGGAGDDLYVLASGFGTDHIADGLRSVNGNRVSFQFGLFGSSLVLGLGSLRISFTDQPGDVLHLEGFDPDDPLANPVIDVFQFTNTTLTFAQLLAFGIDIGGTPDADFLNGTGADDRISALASNDMLLGRAGNDRLDGGLGADTSFGGTGNDTFVVDDSGDVVNELIGEGSDDVESSITYTLTANVENLTLTGAAALDGTGNELANALTGNAANNRLDGAAGADLMAGGLGDDTYVVDDVGDVINEGADAGTDSVESSVSHALASNVENLTLTGTADVNGTGNGLANVILGNSGANTLDGGAGADTLIGGAGNDTYVVDTAGDIVTEASGEGIDTVRSSVTYTLGAELENLTLLGSALNGTGNGLDNIIIGNGLANVLTGLGGNDTLIGGANNDTLDGGEGADTLSGEAGNDSLTGGQGVDTLAGGTGDDNLIGGEGNDTLTGDAGFDLLDGGTGADVMEGGADGDTYLVDDSADVVRELGSDGQQDIVQSSATYTLAADALVELYQMTGSAEINVTGNQHTTIYEGNEAANVITDVAGGDDVLAGFGGNDTLISGNGNNVLDGGTGVDHMEGGAGSDIYYVDETADVIVESLNAGFEEVYSTATYTLSANLEWLQLFEETDGTGNDIDNFIYGSEFGNTIRGLGGSDLLFGFEGDDAIEGGEGDDRLDGGQGDDQLDGGAGDDNLLDWSGTNTLAGGSGDDVYDIRDTVQPAIIEQANEGTDLVIASADHALSANVENLRLVNTFENELDAVDGSGNELDNIVVGNDYRNVLEGLGGNDVLDGRAGDDLLVGGAGDDQIFGGFDRAGFEEDDETEDFLFFRHENDDVLEGGDGNDDLDGGSGNDELYGDDGNDVLYGGDDEIVFSGGEGGYGGFGGGEGGYGGGEGAFLTNDDILEGGAGDDELDGGSGNDELYGGDGIDTLYGGGDGPYNIEGYDWLDGGAGIDYMAGGTWDDTYWVDGTYVEEADPTAVDECGVPIPGATRRIWTTDVIVENEDEGFDTVYSEASIVLPANFERVILIGEENLDATSGAGEQILVGNDANNRLDGGAGEDYLAGGLGNDTVVVDSAGDFLEEFENEGIDTIESSIDFTLGANFENLTLVGAAVTGTGNAVDNVIRGNTGNNQLFGLEGNDELNGGAGNDELRGGDGADVYRFGVGSGQDVVIDTVGLNSVRLLGDLTSADLTLSQSGDNLVLTIDATGDQLTLVGWNAVAALSSGNVLLCVCGCPVDFNSEPLALPDLANVVEDVTLVATGSVLANDTDPDAGTTLTVTDPRTVEGAFGTLVLNADGSYTFTLNNALVQPLAAGQTLSQVFDYTITDSHASDPETSSSTLTIVVTGINDAPVANDETGSVAEDGVLTSTGNVLSNDTDVDQGSTLSVTNGGTFAGTYGTLTLGSDGAYTYELNNASTAVQSLGQGETELEVFGYDAADNATPSLSDPATLTISVVGANDAPILVTPLNDQSTDEGEAFSYTVPLDAFTDIDRNDVLSYTAALADGSALPEWLTFNASTRQFTGTPPVGAAGSYDVRVVVTDLFGASASDVFAVTVAVADPTSDTLYFTKDGCWPAGSVSAGGACLDGLSQTHGVYDGGAGTDTLVGTECADAILLEDETSPRPPGTSGPRLVSIEIIDAGGGNDVVDLSSTLYTYGPVTVHGGEGDDTLIGGAGANVLNGDAGFDTLVGGAANDVLDGGASCDTMAGGLGNDEYHVDDECDVVIEECDSGTDTVISSVSVCLAANVENLVLVGTAVAGHGNELDNVITGSSGDNELSGGEGTDTLQGGAGNDVYYVGESDAVDVVVEVSGEGTDEVRSLLSYVLTDNVENLTLLGGDCPADLNATGNSGANVLTGNAGNNVLDGAGGADTMVGGAGDDTYVLEGSDDVTTELAGEGHDTVRSALSHTLGANIEDLELLGSGNANATGNALDNALTGNAGDNVMEGGAGNDLLRGGAGADTYHFSAGFGHDTVQDTIAVDPVTGAPDEDGSVDVIRFDATITPADIVLRVGSTNPRDLQIDVLSTGDRLSLRNFLADDGVSDRVEEIRFADGTTWTSANVLAQFSRVFGTEGDDVLSAVPTGSLLYGRGGHDQLNAGTGSDVLDGGAGDDEMTGGAGDDAYIVDDWYDEVIENAGEGTDTVYATVSVELSANVENAVLEGSGSADATGNELANVLIGNSAGNVLDGGAGADTMRGGDGDDAFVVDSTGDIVIENAGEGWDHVHSDISYVLGANVEGLELEGSAHLTGTGNADDNQLVGNIGNNLLDGGAGADYMAGGAGDDTYVVDSESDQIAESSNKGNDTVHSSVTFVLDANVENLILLGTDHLDGTGNSLANTLTGNAGNNALNGGGGADSMIGGAGDDTYTVNVTGDQVVENAGEGVDTVRSSVSYTLGVGLEHLTLTGSGAVDAYGNDLDNILTGNGGVNRLEGGAGNDTLTGGGGADTMIGGAGDDIYFVNAADDVVTENAGEGFDIVNSSVGGTMAQNIEALFLTGSSSESVTGNALNNLIRGNSGANVLQGDAGIDVLEGGGGSDTLTDTTGPSLFNGGSGADTMTGSAVSDFFLGGLGNDVVNTGGGADVIVFNRGDGKDTVNASAGLDDTLSLGDGILYADLLFKKSGNDLILVTGSNEQLTFVDWYADPANQSVETLQLIIEGTSDYDGGSADPLRNQRIQAFDFAGLVAAFDAARTANPALTSWALANALTTFHAEGSDTAAIGGDLAYLYGRDGTLADISFNPALGIMGGSGFGSASQALQPIGNLQDSSPRLGV